MTGSMDPAAVPQLSASDVFRRALIRAVVYPVLLMLVLIGVFLWQLGSLLNTNARVQQSNNVIAQASVVLKLLVDMETGLRGYLMTGDRLFLEPYENAQTALDTNFQQLQASVSDNPSQTTSLMTLQSDIEAWQTFAANTLETDTSDPGVDDIATQVDGKERMDSVRQQLEDFVEAEDQLRADRIRVTQTTTQIVIISVVIAGLTVGGLLIVTIRQQLIALSRSYRQSLILSQQQTEEISNQKEWLRGVLSGMGEAVIATDMRGRITFVNQVTETLTGWSPQMAEGKSLAEIYKVAADLSDTATPHVDTPTNYPHVSLSPMKSKQLTTRDGHEITIEDTASSIKDVHGSPIGQVIVFRDVTQRKRIEQERLHLIKVQTHYASMLSRSNENLQQFAYVASHDLQEPLRMVISYLQLIERRYGEGQVLDSDAREFIDFAVDGANRMKELIMGLLAYARVDRAEQELQTQTSLEEALNRALNNLSVAITDSGATVTHESLPQLQADSLQMMQLFQNLIGNALKFRADQPLHIHVGAENKGDEWQFSIQDNGIGIPLDSREKIFGLFHRLNSRRQYSGTGIGLAICKKVVERHQGRIWVESEVGKGSTFYFTLPLKQSPNPLIANDLKS